MGTPQTFRSPTALAVWVVWLLFAVGNWIDLAVQGRDHLSAVAAALLLLATGAAYVTAQRPRVIADDAGLTIRNPLREHRIGWAGVAKVDVIDLLRVHCDGGVPGEPGDNKPGDNKPGDNKPGDNKPGDNKHRKVISAWAVHYSRRRQFTAEARARRAARPRRSGLGLPSRARDLSYGTGSYSTGRPAQENSPEAEAEKIVRLLSERATAARAEAVWAAGTATTTTTARTEPLTSTWSARAVAALVIPALIVLIIWLL